VPDPSLWANQLVMFWGPTASTCSAMCHDVSHDIPTRVQAARQRWDIRCL